MVTSSDDKLEIERGGLMLGILRSGAVCIKEMMRAPFDRVKLLLQTQAVNEKLVGKNYKGIVDAFKRIRKEEGRRAFWRGGVPMVLKSIIYDDIVSPTEYFNFLGFVLAYPLELARTRLAADVGKGKSERQFTGFLDCFRKVYKAEGIQGIYRGFGALSMGIMVYKSILSVGSRYLYPFMDDLPPNSILSHDLKFFASHHREAQLLFTSGFFLYYPFDTVSRRLMVQSGRKDVLYTGTVDCFKKIAQNEGLKGFYKGCLIPFFGLWTVNVLFPNMMFFSLKQIV